MLLAKSHVCQEGPLKCKHADKSIYRCIIFKL